MKIKILIAQHREFKVPNNDVYMPIHVGKSQSNVELGIQGDNTGDNISNKNKSYCELTALYWAWKNLKDVDIIGLCHYRRYFDFRNQINYILPTNYTICNNINDLDFSIPDRIIQNINKGKVYVTKPLYYPYPLVVDYSLCHISDDLRILQQIIETTQEKRFIDAYLKVMYSDNKLIHYNMFLMKWNDFDKYCNWLFPLLSEMEKHININTYNPIQQRIWGYMAERLFNVWLIAEKKDVLYKNVIMIDEQKINIVKDFTKRILTYLLGKLHCLIFGKSLQKLEKIRIELLKDSVLSHKSTN